MSDEMLITLGSFLVMLLALGKPIITLNTSITELKSSIDQLKDIVNKLDSRITEHGKELDALRTTVTEHEVRIKTLEETK